MPEPIIGYSILTGLDRSENVPFVQSVAPCTYCHAGRIVSSPTKFSTTPNPSPAFRSSIDVEID